MHEAVLVSVVMPVFNGEQYLSTAIDSILNQSYTLFEFIIIDDGSNDNSLSIIESYVDPRIKVIKNPSNLGLIKSLNKGIAMSAGKYICRFDCDDISYVNRIKRQVIFMEENPGIVLLGTWARRIGLGTKILSKYMRPQIHHNSIRFRMMFESAFIHPTVMFRNNIANNKLKYNESYAHAEDYELWLRLSQEFRVANLPEVLLDYRVHVSSVSNVFSAEQSVLTSKLRVEAIESYLASLDLFINPIHMINSDATIESFDDFLKSFTLLSERALAEGVCLKTIKFYFWREHCKNAKLGSKLIYGYLRSPFKGGALQVLSFLFLALIRKSR